MMIFDRFRSYGAAKTFARLNGGQVFKTQVESNRVDPFPYELRPPIVLVPRTHADAEERLIRAAKMSGGEYAGT